MGIAEDNDPAGPEAAAHHIFTRAGETLMSRAKVIYNEIAATKRVAGRLSGTKKPTTLDVGLAIHRDLAAISQTLLTLTDSI